MHAHARTYDISTRAARLDRALNLDAIASFILSDLSYDLGLRRRQIKRKHKDNSSPTM